MKNDADAAASRRWPLHGAVIAIVLFLQGANVFFNPAKVAWMLIPLIGFLLIGLSVAHKIGRTGEVTQLALANVRNDRAERLLLVYGVLFFASGIVFPLLLSR